MASEGKSSNGCGCWGLVSFLLFVIVVWALLFGVTLDGRHYGLSCSTERGVELQTGEPAPDAPK
jgi:hypothetical protein